MTEQNANRTENQGHDDPSRASAGEGPDAQPDGQALDEDEQDPAPDADPDHETTDDDALAAEDEAAKLGDFV